MSEINHDQFEAWVNRYLDGELTDNEFEKYLRSIDADLDLEKLRLLRTRIERIEELYRQIEEPAVPDGYWDEFADRVAAKLPADTRPSLMDRIFAFFSPSRWPNATYRYAGAVASVLVVFLIGKSLMKSGSEEYIPHDYPVVQVEEIPPSPSGEQITIEEAGKIEVDVMETVEPKSEQKVELVEQPIDESAPVQPTEDVVQRIKAEKDVMEMSKPTSNVTISGEQIEAMPIKKFAADQSTITSETSGDEFIELDSESGLPSSVGGSSPVTELEKPSEEVVADKIELRTEKDKSLTYMKTSVIESEIRALTISVERGRTVWKYDGWSLDSLLSHLNIYETLLTDSLYADSAFIEIAEIKSSIALITRDSTDVYDAISAIDSLLIHNPDADSQKWTVRRAQLDRILENLNNR